MSETHTVTCKGDAYSAKFVTPWVEIDRDQYDYDLCVLPPEKWETCEGVSLFRCMERMTFSVTKHTAAYKGRYFSRYTDVCKDYSDYARQVKSLVDQ